MKINVDHPQVDNKLVMTETLDSGSTAVVYATFGAAVYDVEIAIVVSNQAGTPHPMKVSSRLFCHLSCVTYCVLCVTCCVTYCVLRVV